MKKQYLFLLFVVGSLLFYPINLSAEPTCSENNVPITEAGTYPVTLYYQDEQGEACHVIYITLKQRHTIEHVDGQEAINAHDLEIPAGYFEQLTDDDLILLTKARAWKIPSNQTVPITTVTRELKNTNIQLYNVTFMTTKGTQTTISVVETPEAFVRGLNSSDTFLNLEGMESYVTIQNILASLLLIIPILILLFNYFKSKKDINYINTLLYK